jgi:YidC/Oxa1 family membrane protein insertase
VEDRRNIILAVVLSALILFGWQYVAQYFFPAPPPPAKTAPAQNVGKDSDAPIVAGDAATKAVPLEAALAGTVRVSIETPKLSGSINLEGAKIDDLVLTKHRVELSKKSPPVRLFAPSGTKDAHFARFGWTGTGATLPTDKTVWTPSASKLTPTAPVTLSWSNPEGQKFEIVLSVDENYLLTAEQRFTNGSAAAAQISPFGVITRKGKSPDTDSWNIHVGPMGVFNNTITHVNYDEVCPMRQRVKSTTPPPAAGWGRPRNIGSPR